MLERATLRLSFFLLTILNTCITYPVKDKNIMDLIELEKEIEKHKVIQHYQDGVVDGLFGGIRSKLGYKSNHYYNRGYDFGLVLWNKQQGDDE